jgi:Tfp pilus assembly protein PilX
MKSQKGSALIVSIGMLTAVTLLAVVSLQGSTTQLKIVNNFQIREEVFTATNRELKSQFSVFQDKQLTSDPLNNARAKVAYGTSEELEPLVETAGTKIGSVETSVKATNMIGTGLNNSLMMGSTSGKSSWVNFELSANSKDQTERFSSNQLMGFKIKTFNVN